MSCGNNVKQLGLALQLYHDVHKTFPPGVIGDDAKKYGGDFNKAYRGFSWGTFLLPFLEEQPLYDRIDFTMGAVAMPGWPPASNYNEDLLTTAPLEEFLCPSDPRRPQDADYMPAPNMGASSYVGNFGTNGYIPNGAANVTWLSVRLSAGWVSSLTPTGYMNARGVGPLYSNSNTALRDVLDGSSNTVLLGERRGDLTDSVPLSSFLTAGQTFWSYGSMHSHVLASAYFRPNKCNRKTPHADLDGCVGTFSSLHPGGLQMCLMDGSVRFISDTIDSADEATLDAIPNIRNPGKAYGVWQAICVIDDGIVVGKY